LRIRGSGKPIFCNFFKFFRVKSRAAARAAERKTRSNNRRIAGRFDNLLGFLPTVRETAFRRRNTDFVHRGFEKLAVFADFD
jgi:hypothetical protein